MTDPVAIDAAAVPPGLGARVTVAWASDVGNSFRHSPVAVGLAIVACHAVEEDRL
jgi:hypothetical protein